MSETDQTDQTTQPEDTDVSPPIPTVDRRLLELLVCPVTKTNLVYDAKAQELISTVARLAYPIRDGIPIMLAEEARQIED
ncbi:MAG: Trm112 family protein [Pseudomonadota bacterium]